MARLFAAFSVLLLAFISTGVTAQEVTRTFEQPTINGVRVDWCKHLASQCGAPAADLYCQEQGYQRAVRFLIDPGIGAFGVPTVFFGDGRICRSPICSGFIAITCAKPADAQPQQPKGGQMVGQPPKAAGPDMQTVTLDTNRTRFRFPKIKGLRVDWCRNWGKNCGKPAANLFCQEQGFARAGKFAMEEGTGKQGIPTLVFGDGRICASEGCNGFRQITCIRGQKDKVAQPETPAKPEEKTRQQGGRLVLLLPGGRNVIVPIPTPKPAPPRQVAKPKPALTTKPPKSDLIVIGPPVNYQRFKPLPAETLTANWVGIIDSLDRYPQGASLFKCSSGDCSLATSADFEVDPEAAYRTVHLNYRVDKVPHASGALWQVSYLPFPPFAKGAATDIEPEGLLASDIADVKEGWFAFDPKDLAVDLPGGAKQAILHVRVLPVAAGSGRIVGQPSNTIRVFYGADLPPQPPFEFYAKEEVEGSRPQIRMTDLVFEPFHQVGRWPPGCKTWEEKYGKKDKNFLEKVGGFFTGAWGWTSKSYQWVKNRVVDIAATLTFNLLPDSALEFALNSALVSAGIPPDIPNLNQIMRDGVDGLAKEVAKQAVQQVPTADLASNVGNLAVDITVQTAAGMAEDELRDRLQEEIEKRSRQAMLQAANELEEQLKAEGKKALCSTTTFHAVYKVTVENTGDETYTDLAITANAEPVYLDRTWNVDLDPGEKMTLVAVASPRLPNGPYSHPLLPPGKREDEDMSRWWNDIVYDEDVEIEVTLPGALKCLGGDAASRFCDRQYFTVHRSPPQKVTEKYAFSP